MSRKDKDIRRELRESKAKSKSDILDVLEKSLMKMYGLLKREKRLHEAKSNDEIVDVRFGSFVSGSMS